MDVDGYRRAVGVDMDDLHSMLKYCAFLRNVAALPHRTLAEFDLFVHDVIFGPPSERVAPGMLPGVREERQAVHDRYHGRFKDYGDEEREDGLLAYARMFVEYCEEAYGMPE